jgi:cytochrome P450
MEVTALVMAFIKYSAFLGFSFGIYLVYQFVINPWLYQRRYRRYPNVYVPEKLNAPAGDIKEMQESVAAGRFRFEYLTKVDAAKYDIRLAHFGKSVVFEIISPKALEQFEKLVPRKIDRLSGPQVTQFYPVFGNCSALLRTGKVYKTHRAVFLKLLGFNFASKYIPSMIDIIDEKVHTWQNGQNVNCLHELGDVALKIIVRICFGKDINDRIRMSKYTHSDGKLR